MHDMAQARPWLSLTVGAFLHCEGPAPRLADLRAHIAANLARQPRLTHYLKGPGLRARWARDPDPDLEQRVRERQIELGESHLDAALQDLLTHPLPDNGPPWDLWLLHGHAPGRFTLCYRAHHTTHDGGGLFDTVYKLFGTSPADATARTTAVPAPRAELGDYARTLTGMLGSAAANNLWNDPDRPLRGARVSAWAQVPTDVLRTTAAARGGSTNDAVLAALAGALRTWSAEHGPRGAGRPVSVAMMVNLRRTAESGLPGNLFTFAPLALPCHRPTPADRLEAVIAATRGPKNAARRAAMRTITDHTPARVFHTLAARLTTPSRAIIDTSYVAINQPLQYQGAPVTHLQVFTWLPHSHPASIVACSYNGTTSAYFVTDQALPGLHQLPALWEQAAAQPTSAQ
ncbi:diacylglycerol O-acyltransferase [Kitasatospora sp. GP30]|nr:diacylglycerol O-acyltransferase [Kitasatospora sp. GP30]